MVVGELLLCLLHFSFDEREVEEALCVVVLDSFIVGGLDCSCFRLELVAVLAA